MPETRQTSQSFPVKVFIADPDGEIGYIVGLSIEKNATVRTYNAYHQALEEVLKGKGLMPLPHKDKFEPLLADNKAQLEALIPDIHERASAILKKRERSAEKKRAHKEALEDAARVLRGEID
ncbi:hypothetical protein KKA95_01525 [Patescibacteria group bacterium]|nr:hypothetical protein [Patescibacteria group bacterium]